VNTGTGSSRGDFQLLVEDPKKLPIPSEVGSS